MLKVSARRMESMFAFLSNSSETAVETCKPDDKELRRVLRFWLNPALIILKKDSNKSGLISGAE